MYKTGKADKEDMSGLYHCFPRHTPGDLAPVTRSQLLRSLHTLSLSTNTVLAPSLYNVDLCRSPRCLKIKTENWTQKYTERRAYVNTGLRHLRRKDCQKMCYRSLGLRLRAFNNVREKSKPMTSTTF